MRIRYINSIMMEMYEWEARALVDFMRENIDKTRLPLDKAQAVSEMLERLEKEIVREW